MLFAVAAFAQDTSTAPRQPAANRSSAPQVADVEVIRERVLQGIRRDTKLPDAKTLENLMTQLSPHGTWPDINYNVTEESGWPPMTHLSRLVQFAAAYAVARDNNQSYRDAHLRDTFLRAFSGWFSVLPGALPQSANWWHNVIGVQGRIVIHSFQAGPHPNSSGSTVTPVEFRSEAAVKEARLSRPSATDASA